MKQMRTVFFWDIIQREVVIPHQRFETIYWSHLQGSRIQKRNLDTLVQGLYREVWAVRGLTSMVPANRVDAGGRRQREV
jgi:N-glycosylase/DNA lyase